MTLAETWTLEEFLATDEFDGRRVELIGGKIHHAAPEDWPNQRAIDRLHGHLYAALTARGHLDTWLVGSRSGTITTNSYIEPDIRIVPADLQRRPTVADCAVLIEVANSTVTRDEGTKRDLVRAEGAKLYYVIDLAGPTLTLWGQTVMALSVPELGIEVEVDELWGICGLR